MAYTPRKNYKRKSIQNQPKVWTKKRKPESFNYQSRKWRNVSFNYRVSNPLCVKCLEEGKTVPSYVTDHIIPVEQGGDPWNEDNFQALCESHHNKKSRSERK